jgi:hypothetical protein
MKKILIILTIMLNGISFAQDRLPNTAKYSFDDYGRLTSIEVDQDNEADVEKKTCKIVHQQLDTSWTSGPQDGTYTVSCSDGTCYIVEIGWFGWQTTTTQTVATVCNPK